MLQLQIVATDPDIALAFAEVPRPEPTARQVLIETGAAGINPADWKFAGAASGLPHPIGLDVAGTIVAMGSEVNSFAMGDRVAGQAPMGAGTVAPYTVARRAAIAPLPAGVSFEQGATLGTAGQAAWAALIEEASLGAGQVVLIHGAGGAVGSFAVQIARYVGARVIATASARHAEMLAKLGVNRHIDYARTRFEDEIEPVDVVFDTVGGETFLRSIAVMRDGGTMVSIANFDDPPRELVERKELHVRQFSMKPKRDRLEALARLVDDGTLQPVIGTSVGLDDAITAVEGAMRGHNQGNVVISIR
jgi:NADPH:quinone reductase-like Zn-dependent oxidoreductase